MGVASGLTTLVTNTTIVVSDLNSNFTILTNSVNNIVADQITDATITYAKLESNVVFTERGDPSGDDFSAGNLTLDTSNWYDLDLSSIVTNSDAKLVLLKVSGLATSTGNQLDFRENGNSNTVNVSTLRTVVAGVTNHADLLVPCDSSQVIEYRGTQDNWTTISITVKGWWK